jgi:hypothetical protein
LDQDGGTPDQQLQTEVWTKMVVPQINNSKLKFGPRWWYPRSTTQNWSLDRDGGTPDQQLQTEVRTKMVVPQINNSKLKFGPRWWYPRSTIPNWSLNQDGGTPDQQLQTEVRTKMVVPQINNSKLKFGPRWWYPRSTTPNWSSDQDGGTPDQQLQTLRRIRRDIGTRRAATPTLGNFAPKTGPEPSLWLVQTRHRDSCFFRFSDLICCFSKLGRLKMFQNLSRFVRSRVQMHAAADKWYRSSDSVVPPPSPDANDSTTVNPDRSAGLSAGSCLADSVPDEEMQRWASLLLPSILRPGWGS